MKNKILSSVFFSLVSNGAEQYWQQLEVPLTDIVDKGISIAFFSF